MKYFWIFFIWIACGHGSLRAQDTLSLYQAYYQFSDAEKTEWTSFLNHWQFFEYSALKKKYRIRKLDCKHCESFYADVYLEIDATGFLQKATVMRVRRCGNTVSDETLFRDFELSLGKPSFRALRNKRFTVRLGTALKC